ncbi:hypothetical protein V1506DRAFT_517375 [Lipomyces tetrasporus]
MSISSDDIKAKCANQPHDEYADTDFEGCDIFLPRNAVASLVQWDKVELTLRQYVDKAQILGLTEYVMKNAQRVFLTLVFCGNINLISTFCEANFTDDDLPIEVDLYQLPRTRQIRRLNMKNTPSLERQDLACFRYWRRFELEAFIENQWIFSAPVLREGDFDYEFHPRCPLPFVPTRHHSRRYWGYLSVVRKLGLLTEHQEIFF